MRSQEDRALPDEVIRKACPDAGAGYAIYPLALLEQIVKQHRGFYRLAAIVLFLLWTRADAENIYADPLPPVKLDGRSLVGTAGLVVYRPDGGFAPANLATVFFNDRVLTRLGAGKFVSACVKPGKMEIALQLSASLFADHDHVAKEVVHAEPGRTYYVEVSGGAAGESLRPVTPGTALYALQTLSPVGLSSDRDAVGRYFWDKKSELPDVVVHCQ